MHIGGVYMIHVLPNMGLKLVIDPTGLPFIYIFIYDCCCGMD